MRKVITLLLALGLLVGATGGALANCGAGHTDTPSPSTGRPPAQT